MRRPIRGLALVVLCAASMAGVASAAQAATPTTLPATHITAKTATLNATIPTGNLQTSWEFQYGLTTGYGKVTKVTVIPSGKGTQVVHAEINKLTPNTTYHFRIAASVLTGLSYYPVFGAVGLDVTFKTHKLGSTGLTGHTVKVKNGIAKLGIKCASQQTCKGTFKATGKSGGKSFSCLSGRFSLKAGKHGAFKPKVTSKCLLALAKLLKHQLKTTITIRTSTGQPTVKQTLTLKL